jgi:hypothetical protein
LLERLREPLRGGTFAPFSLASFNPIAMACLRLLTRRPEPLFNVPFFLRCIADFTLRDAADLRFAIQAPPMRLLCSLQLSIGTRHSAIGNRAGSAIQRWQTAQ